MNSQNLLFSTKFGKLTFDGLEGDFSLDDYKGYSTSLTDCGRDELMAILHANANNSKRLIQEYFNNLEDANWDNFNGDYASLINFTLESDGSFNLTNFQNHFLK